MIEVNPDSIQNLPDVKVDSVLNRAGEIPDSIHTPTGDSDKFKP